MSETDLAATITDMATPLAASLGLRIWGVEAAIARRSVIRVYAEGENGISIDDCAELSRLLGLALEVEDVTPGAYVLEVSSPGLERKFFTAAQLAAHVGKRVDVSLHSPCKAYPDRKKLVGTLTGAENGAFFLIPLDAPENDPALAEFAWDDIKRAKLVHIFPDPGAAIRERKRKKESNAGGTSAPSGKTPAEDA